MSNPIRRRGNSRPVPDPCRLAPCRWAAVFLFLTPPLFAQDPAAVQGLPAGQPDPLEVLVQEALATHPEVRSAMHRSEAAQARVLPETALPDPVLSGGFTNVPVTDPGLSADPMSMVMIRLEQRLPARGLRAAREAVARAEAEAEAAAVDRIRWSVATRLREAYFELLLVDQAVEVHHRTHAALEALARSAETAFAQGLAPQADVLRAHTELAGIAEHLSELRQRRAAALAELNTLLGRETRAPIHPVVPERLQTLIEADPDPGFLAASVMAAELGGGFPTLSTLEDRAVRTRPELTVARHQVEAARSREHAAVRDRRPGVTLMGEYGARSGRPDFVSFGVAVELPLFRGRRQDQVVREAREDMGASEMRFQTAVRDVRREVAEAHADLVRTRERILLLDESVIPQARATVESRTALYGSGDGDFTSLMQAQAILYRSEIERAHLTSEAGRKLARLEQATASMLIREEER